MTDELYKKYRPRSFKNVIGQAGAVRSLEALIKRGLPHALLFSGPSGDGKTTLARIVAQILECGEPDLNEINAANTKGVDTIRDIDRYSRMMPVSGPVRVYLIDEAHMLTKDAMNAILKVLEDPPKRAYFMLCTTDPQKLIKTIHTRCSEIKLSALSLTDLGLVCQRVIDKEGLSVSETVLKEIVEAADGSARKALVILEQVGYIEGEEAQLEAIKTTTINKDLGMSLARLLYNPSSKWQEVAAVLKEIKDDPEGVRYLVLGYARSCLLGRGDARAFKIIDVFSKNFYDSKKAGLAAACYEVVCLK